MAGIHIILQMPYPQTEEFVRNRPDHVVFIFDLTAADNEHIPKVSSDRTST